MNLGGTMVRSRLIPAICVLLAVSGCDKLRAQLPEELARHWPGAEGADAIPQAPPAPLPAPAPPAVAPELAKDLPVVPQVSLADSLLAAGSVAANLLEPAQPGAETLQAQAAQPPKSRGEKAVALLRAAGVELADGAVRDEGERLVLSLEAADADHYEEELVTQWALGFAVLGALGAPQVAVVTLIDGTPMVEITASALDIQALAAESIDTGEFFRRATFKRLGPEADDRLDAAVQADTAVEAEDEAEARPAKSPGKMRVAPATGRASTNRAPSSGRATGAAAPYQRGNSGRAPR
jgi:hypothetical protein